MNVPSAAIVTLPPAVVAEVPAVTDIGDAGRSLAKTLADNATNGVDGDVVVPPVTTAWVLLTRLLYVSGAVFGATVNETFFVPVQLPTSVAVITALNVPVAPGVPVTAPLPELMLMPVGKPVADHAIVGFPPICVNVDVAIAVLNTRFGIVPLTVIVGHTTLNVNDWFAAGETPLFALIVIAYGDPDWVPAAGVPAIVAVPLLLSVNVTADGRVPVFVMTIEAPAGNPVVVTLKLCPALPGAKVTLLALVICGA